ncbi:sodium:proton exchanger [Actinomycetospora chibensis]|uniref:Sodium:proton exchanger n=1 Tax=Actinomycetospora chibensis TaxID=663606 RepID=A0ABV9RQS3_9PSEU|nr:sodium:proton exchanger [Actinomycetospora chibensis]MDD7923267.1 sodium:proton exchanger [Actinomycetospora chibensis]
MTTEGRRRPPGQLVAALLAAMPGLVFGAATYLGLPHPEMPPPLAAVVYGVAIIGAAFTLSWGAEAAQVDISAGLAIALLALIAVLPEYAVDFVFTWQAGQIYEANGGQCVPLPGGANPCSLALANMTGANRVLVGVGWPLIILVASIAVWRSRRHGGGESSTTHHDEVDLAPAMSAEVVFLGLATLYSLTLPLRTSLTLLDLAVFVAIFAAYAWRLAQAPAQEPDLVGVSAWAGEKPRRARRAWVLGMFAVAGLVILATAEHFAQSLVDAGTELGIDQFLLVQWVAPLASESPELIVACLYAMRLKASDSLGTLLSSKVNQWTLLVGTIPLVFAVSATTIDGLPLDMNQRLELLITAAQSLFAVALLMDLRLSRRGAAALFTLFAVQFTVSVTAGPAVNRITILVLSAVYILLAIAQMLRLRRRVARTVRDGFAAPYAELEQDEPAAR